MQVQTYLNFNGRCEEAIEFYKKAVDAKVGMLMRFKDSPEQSEDCKPADQNKVMHSSFNIGDTLLMATDGMLNGEKVAFDGFSLSLTCKDVPEVDAKIAALGQGGTVTMPGAETFFAKKFAMLKDKFGVHWIVIAPKPM
ncbi:MAG TPA: VOC family protein [Pseudolabrys sp.]|nr:VOC family protein [Pseudolabrys sp.]